MDESKVVNTLAINDPMFQVHRSKYATWFIDSDKELACLITDSIQWIDPRWGHQGWWFTKVAKELSK